MAGDERISLVGRFADLIDIVDVDQQPNDDAVDRGYNISRCINLTDIRYNSYNVKEGNGAILVKGFTKKTQRTPIREIEKANLYRIDYYVQNNKRGLG